MKKNIINWTAILSQEMTKASAPGEACSMGDAYFLAAEDEAYKALSKEEISSLLRSAHVLQKENGMIHLYEDQAMPGDARVDIVYKPSYSIAAVAIYANQHYPEIFDSKLSRFFHDLLEGAFCHGVVGHGYEAPETVRRTMLMLCKAGLRTFLETHQEQHPVFAKAMYNHMDSFLELGKKIDEEQLIVTANSFSADSINHLVKQLIALWNGNDRPVFVYGTLMKGKRASGMLSGGEYAGIFQLREHAMYDLGSYPGIKPCAGESVLGELYFVNGDTIAQLDRYEGEGDLYDRISVELKRGNSNFTAETYIYKQDISGCKKSAGSLGCLG